MELIVQVYEEEIIKTRQEIKDQNIRIVAVAILKDEEIWYFLGNGQRHSNLLSGYVANAFRPQYINQNEFGFLTSNGRFVSRWRANQIALVSKQIKTMKGNRLSSEDLWNNNYCFTGLTS